MCGEEDKSRLLLSDFLDEGSISIIDCPPEKDEMIRRVIEELCRRLSGVDVPHILGSILERDRKSTTTLDSGLCIPHTRVVGLARVAGVLAVIPKGIHDPDNPEVIIKAMLVFLCPADQSFFHVHIHFLRHLATVFQPAFIERLVRAGDPRQVMDLIRGSEQKADPE